MKSNLYTRTMSIPLALMFVLSFFQSHNLLAQKLVTIGTPASTTTTQEFPFNDTKNYGRSASIYTATQIGNTVGTITRMDWFVKTVSALPLTTIRIYLKETDLTEFPADTAWASLTAGADTVLSGTNTFNTLEQWNPIFLQKVFLRNSPTKNLMVLCEFAGTAQASSPKFSYTQGPVAPNAHTSVADDLPANVTNLARNKKLPDVQFPILTAPLTFGVTSPTGTSLTLNWTSDSFNTNVLILRSKTGTFAPLPQGGTTAPPASGQTFFNDTIAYNGSSSPFIDGGLESNRTYYYKILTYYADNSIAGTTHYYFSQGKDASGTTITSLNNIGLIDPNTKFDTTVCQTADTVQIFGNNAGLTKYTWQWSATGSDPWTVLPNDTLQNYKVPVSTISPDTKKYFQRIAATTTSNSVNISVSKSSQAGAIDPAAAIKCQGDSVTLTITGEVVGSIVKWQKIKSYETVWTDIEATSSVLKIAASDTGVWWYRAVVKSGACDAAYSSLSVITINLRPTISAAVAQESICSGQTNTITLTASPPGTYTFAWTRDQATTITGIDVSGTTNPITGTFTSSSSSSVNVTFTCTASNGSCTSAAVKPVVMVKAAPVVGDITGPKTVCSQASTYSLSEGSGYTYSWAVPAAKGTIQSGQSSASVTIQWKNLTAQDTALLKGTVTSSGCPATKTLQVTLTPGAAPTADVLKRKTTIPATQLFLMCSNPAHINDSAAKYSFTWGYVDSKGTEVINTNFADKYFCLWDAVTAGAQYYYVDMRTKGAGESCYTRTKYIVSNDKLALQELYEFYPNPTHGSVNLLLENSYTGDLELVVYSCLGNECGKIPLSKTQDSQVFQISLSALPVGTYFAMLKYPGGERMIKKVVVY